MNLKDAGEFGEGVAMHDNNAVVRTFLDLVLTKGEIESSGRFFWEDMVEHVPLPGQGPGLAGLKDVLRGMRTAFPDMHWSVEEQIAEGDKVVTRFEWTGTHRAEFFGVPATGRSVKVWGDALGLMMQLGACPSP
jgi:steroid delta-isomerase-like uncharacterized protein